MMDSHLGVALPRLANHMPTAAIVVLLASATSAMAAAPEIFPLAQVKRGQTGYGLTTMKGYVPERFTFEVISVVPNFLPKQAIILVKSDDPKLQVTGFWQGMSGSPLYIDDKLVCAFSYGFRFNKISVGGCTPIAYMLEDARLPRRGPSPTRGAAQPLRTAEFLPPSAFRVAREVAAPSLPGYVTTASIPLALAGFTTKGAAMMEASLAPLGIVPVQGGGGSGAPKPDAPKQFVMGGSISVQFIRGDMSAAATGTVSYIDGPTVLAFGHPLFQMGEIYAPVATAEVHTVIASAQSAFVVASPQHEIGALVFDRQSSILADTRLRSPMIPVHIRLTTNEATPRQHEFNVEVLRNKTLTPALVANAFGNALSRHMPERDDVTGTATVTLQLHNQPALTFVDVVDAGGGIAEAAGGLRGLRVLAPLLNNAYAPIEVDAITVDLNLDYGTRAAELRDLRVPAAELKPGTTSRLELVFERFGEAPFVETLELEVPRELAGTIATLELIPGGQAKPDTAPPADLASLMRTARAFVPGNQWVINWQTADEGAAVLGQQVRDLPASKADKLRPHYSTQRLTPMPVSYRRLAPMRQVRTGTASTLVRIAPATP